MAVYACSDLHGYYNIYEKIQAMLKPKDKVYFLGDAGDRGPESLRTIKAILTNPQWIYLKGNHEDMLVNAMRKHANSDALWLAIYNGGKQTLADLKEDPDKTIIINQLADLPCYAFYHSDALDIDYHMCHAGFTPKNNSLNVYEFLDKHDLIWDRRHIELDEDPGYIYYVPENYFNAIILHGHTPIDCMTDYYAVEGKWLGEPMHSPYQYSQKKKVNIDAGTYRSNEAFLFNLDTFTFDVIKGE